MDPKIKKIIYGLLMLILIIILVLIIVKLNKKEEPKTELKNDFPQEEKEEKEEKKEEDYDIVLPSNNIKKSITCNYNGEEYNVEWEKSIVTFHLDENDNVLIQEDVREYKFIQVDIDDYINNKTLTYISAVLDGIKGISSTLTTINQDEHTYRFSTVYNYEELALDDLYNFYYKRFYNNGDIEMSKEQFDAVYKSLKFNDLSKTYINKGYVCE